MCFLDFFFNDTATTEIYTLSLHDALPIYCRCALPSVGADLRPRGCDLDRSRLGGTRRARRRGGAGRRRFGDRKSTRLNSSHANISYAVFCLKKKNECYMYDHLSGGTSSVS